MFRAKHLRALAALLTLFILTAASAAAGDTSSATSSAPTALEETVSINLEKRRQYEELSIATFYLENIEVKDMMTALRSLLGVKNIAANEEMASITLRDRTAVVELAGELVRLHDVPRAEVAIAIEVIAIDSDELTRLRQGFAAGPQGKQQSLSAAQLETLRGAGSAERLAQPQLYAQAGEKAEVRIGDRIPFGTGAGGESRYQTVGLELAVVSQAHVEKNEVTLDLTLGISRLAYVLESEGRAAEPVAAVRDLRTSFRLGEGEVLLFTGFPTSAASDDATVAQRRPSDPLASSKAPREIVIAVSAALSNREDLIARTEPTFLRIGNVLHPTLRGPAPTSKTTTTSALGDDVVPASLDRDAP
jgi:type II secretory pathway component GspD/PulD (secretin)